MTRSTQHGIALVMVLWLLVLLTVIASSHSRNIRTETRLAFNHVESVKARHLAEAAINHAILELLVADPSQRWKADGSIRQVSFDQGEADISVRDTAGLVDINAAGAPLLDTLLRGAGLEDGHARQSLIDATLDWRDRDQLKHLRGAEDDEYRQAGLQWAARDDLFASVEELRYVLGMTNDLYLKLAPYLTVHSGSSNVRRGYAPPWLAQVLGHTPGSAVHTPVGATTVRITARATTRRGTTTSISAEVKFGANGNKPYTILSWRMPAQLISSIEIPENSSAPSIL